MKDNNTLNFIGNGSCFNTDFGNNSAYYIDKKKQSLLLIDCGESVFTRIMKHGGIYKAKCMSEKEINWLK